MKFTNYTSLRIRKQFTKEIKKPKPSMMTIPFISVYKLTSRTPRSFSKIKLFAQHISLLTFLVFVIAEEVNIISAEENNILWCSHP